jgi:hypothetical protein
MENLLPRTIIAMFLLLTSASAHTQQTPTQAVQDVASILERCWRADEIKSSRGSDFSSRNTDFDQEVGLFRGEVHMRWCRTSLEAWGPVERRGKRKYLARIDSLTLHLSTDTITAELRERAGEPPRLTVNGHPANADWWRAGSRERVLQLARVPLP